MLLLGVCRMSLFLANSVPFGIRLTMTVICVVEKEAAVGVVVWTVLLPASFLYRYVCVYI